MIEAEGPDGAVHEFPDGTDQAVIRSALAKHYGWNSAPQQEAPQAAPQKEQGGFLQKADDLVRMAANGFTSGYADKFAAYMNGDPAEKEYAKSEEAAKRAGWAGTAAEIAGNVAGPGKLIGGGVSMAAKAVPLLTKFAPALTGAGLGALDAAGHDRDIAEGAAFGAGAGVLGDAAAKGISSAVSGVAGMFNKKPNIPSLDDLEALKTAAYKRADAAGGVVNKDAIQRLADALRANGADFGYVADQQPSSAGVYKLLKDYEGNNVTMKGLETLRKAAGRTWESRHDSDAALGGKLKATLDDFTNNLGEHDLVPGFGDAKAANEAFTEARGLAQRAFKTADLEQALATGERRTMKTGVGGNGDNVIRQNVDKLLNSNTKWTPDEKAALEETVNGTPTRNLLRAFGRFSPVGNSLTGLLEAGAGIGTAMAGGPHASLPVLAVGTAGFGSKMLADALTKRAANKAGDIMRAGGSKAAAQAAPNAVQRLAKSKQNALAKALMSGAVTLNPERAPAP